VSPEYNHGIPAALKNAIDFLFTEWKDKAAGFVSYGGAGGARAVEHLRLVLAEVHVATVRAQVLLSLADDFESKFEICSGPRAFSENGRAAFRIKAARPFRAELPPPFRRNALRIRAH
jgi:NAD(P)H-dependent FMN reductase